MRLGEKGRYRRLGELYKASNGFFSQNPVYFKFKYEDGTGMQKDEFKLFSNWIMQSGRAVIETNSLDSFEKGDKVKLDGDEYLINRVNTHVYSSLNGIKRITNKRTVIYCE